MRLNGIMDLPLGDSDQLLAEPFICLPLGERDKITLRHGYINQMQAPTGKQIIVNVVNS